MLKICFICLGNICRSPMAMFMMKSKLKSLGLEDNYIIDSFGTSYEEEGNDMYPLAKDILIKNNIDFTSYRAKRLESDDLDKFDMFICMDEGNLRDARRILGDSLKIIKLLKKDISDPWYTRDFNKTYREIDGGLDKLIGELQNKF